MNGEEWYEEMLHLQELYMERMSLLLQTFIRNQQEL